MPSPDPTNPVSIALPSPGAYQFICDPPSLPPAVTPGEGQDIGIASVQFTCDLTSVLFGDLRLPTAVIEYSLRGCYVTTPNSLDIAVPASADLSQQLEDRLGDGILIINRETRTTAGEVFSAEIVTANLDSWSMKKTRDEWIFYLSGSKVVTYTDPHYRTIASVSAKSGDFSDYAKDKTLTMSGWDSVFVSPADYIAYQGIGLYVDKLTARIWKRGYEVTATQFGRF